METFAKTVDSKKKASNVAVKDDRARFKIPIDEHFEYLQIVGDDTKIYLGDVSEPAAYEYKIDAILKP